MMPGGPSQARRPAIVLFRCRDRIGEQSAVRQDVADSMQAVPKQGVLIATLARKRREGDRNGGQYIVQEQGRAILVAAG